MELNEEIESLQLPAGKSVLTIGNFDGVHIGHQALLNQVIETASRQNMSSVAVTFDPHPLRALKKNGPPLITRKDQKIELIESLGIDRLVLIPFTRAFAEMPPEAFVQDILMDRLGMSAIIVGPDYTFGKDRAGDIELLKTMGRQKGFELMVPDWVRHAPEDAERISSTRIRQLVMAGRVDEARPLLGRHYQIRGKVIQGRRRGGAQLGCPTANIKLHDELCPKMGVYAVTVETLYGTHNGVANIGYSPTFDDFLFTIEVHILDFDRDIYGTRIRVNMIRRLRDEIKFSSIDQLSAQIQEDISNARKLLA